MSSSAGHQSPVLNPQTDEEGNGSGWRQNPQQGPVAQAWGLEAEYIWHI